MMPYYELRVPSHLLKKSPSRIEFQLIPKHQKPKRTVSSRKNIYTRSGCDGRASQSRSKEPNKPKFKQNLKRVFFKFNQTAYPARSEHPPMERNDESEQQPKDPEQFENMEIYYFDHGSSEFYRTTDCPPHLVTEALAQSTHYHATKFWAEIFGTLNIGTTFAISFCLQLYRFLLYGILRAVLVGVLQITADYLFKPLLAVAFNGLIQPPIVFVQNILTALGAMVQPVANLIGDFLQPVGRIVQSFRVIEHKTVNKKIIKKGRFDI